MVLCYIILVNLCVAEGSCDSLKRHIPKVMLLLSAIFFVWGIITFAGSVYIDGWFRLPTNDIRLNVILLFSFAGLFLALYRIIDLLERKQ